MLGRDTEDFHAITLEEMCARGLSQIRHNLGTMKNTNPHPNSSQSTFQSTLDGMIHSLQTYRPSPNAPGRDALDSLTAESIDSLNRQRSVLAAQSDEPNALTLDDHISAAIHLMSDYQRMVMVHELHEKKFSSDQSERVDESSTPSNLSKALDSTQTIITPEYPGAISPRGCRPLPYTSTNEKGSSENLPSDFIPSKALCEKSKSEDRKSVV